MYRLFIAINLKPIVIEQIQNICYGVKFARWVPRDQMHVTIRFIGECDSHQFEDIQSLLSQISFPSFLLTLEGVGYFPPRGKPRILWVGIKETSELKRLRGFIDNNLEHIDIPKEKKKFHPHVTIARLGNNTSPTDLIPFLTANSLFKIDSISIKNFHLYSSILRQEGALHRIEESYSLGN